MKKILLIASALVAGSVLSAAEAPKSSYSVTIDFPYTSQYIFRGVDLAKSSIQPSVEVTMQSFYFGIWTNQPVVKNIDNEFDLYAGYKMKLNDTLEVDAGVTNYYYPELDNRSGGKRSTVEGYVGLNANVKGFTPGVYVYHDINLEVTTIQAQMGYSIPLPEAGLSFDVTGTVGRVDFRSGSDYTYWSIGANMPYKLNDKSTVYAGATFTNNNLSVGKGDFLTWNVGVSVGF